MKKRKKEYMIITRKLRKIVSGLKKHGKISDKEVNELRKKIKNRFFKSKGHFKEYLGGKSQ